MNLTIKHDNSSDVAIRVRGLGKKYILGGEKEKYSTFRDVFINSIKKPFQKKNTEKIEFWALNNLSFDIKKGEVIGIIGKNGAGKSTLLKILSRITMPTTGEVEIHGRVGSLLEVGTGFHPELTGRENVYLSGSILGMKKHEIEEKFDEIVKFSGVEQFIDTPVKRYSSGMYVRLAFAVAAHLDTEILLIDEVLAVGDVEFQKKCLGKIGDVANEGKTILFVSHNMNAIEQLCDHIILFDTGIVKAKGSNVSNIIKQYLLPVIDPNRSIQWLNTNSEFNNSWFIPEKIYICDKEKNYLTNPINNNQELWLHIEGTFRQIDPGFEIGYSVYNEDGTIVLWSFCADQSIIEWPELYPGKYQYISKIPKRLLNEGYYKIELYSCLRNRAWILEPGKQVPTIFIQIQGGLSDSPYFIQKRPGVIAPIFEWNGQKISN